MQSDSESGVLAERGCSNERRGTVRWCVFRTLQVLTIVLAEFLVSSPRVRFYRVNLECFGSSGRKVATKLTFCLLKPKFDSFIIFHYRLPETEARSDAHALGTIKDRVLDQNGDCQQRTLIFSHKLNLVVFEIFHAFWRFEFLLLIWTKYFMPSSENKVTTFYYLIYWVARAKCKILTKNVF